MNESFVLKKTIIAVTTFVVAISGVRGQALDSNANIQTGHTASGASTQAPKSDSEKQSDLCLKRGAEKFKAKDYTGALVDCTEALKLNPNSAGAYFNRGVLHELLGESQAAIEDYGESIRLQPENPIAYNNRGHLKEDEKDYEGGIHDFTQAIRLKPDYAHAYGNRAYAKDAKGDHAGAVADCNEAIRIDPDFTFAYNNRGMALAALGRYEESISDYDTAIRLDPKYAHAYNGRGCAKDCAGDHKGAVVDLSQAIQLNPTYAFAFYNRAVAENKLGDYKGALADCNEAVRLDPNYAKAFIQRGVASGNLGDHKAAATDFDRGQHLSPNVCVNDVSDLFWNQERDHDEIMAKHAELLVSSTKVATNPKLATVDPILNQFARQMARVYIAHDKKMLSNPVEMRQEEEDDPYVHQRELGSGLRKVAGTTEEQFATADQQIVPELKSYLEIPQHENSGELEKDIHEWDEQLCIRALACHGTDGIKELLEIARSTCQIGSSECFYGLVRDDFYKKMAGHSGKDNRVEFMQFGILGNRKDLSPELTDTLADVGAPAISSICRLAMSSDRSDRAFGVTMLGMVLNVRFKDVELPAALAPILRDRLQAVSVVTRRGNAIDPVAQYESSDIIRALGCVWPADENTVDLLLGKGDKNGHGLSGNLSTDEARALAMIAVRCQGRSPGSAHQTTPLRDSCVAEIMSALNQFDARNHPFGGPKAELLQRCIEDIQIQNGFGAETSAFAAPSIRKLCRTLFDARHIDEDPHVHAGY